jgi:hypothetical protein
MICCPYSVSRLTSFPDPHILSIDNVEIVAIKADADSRNPTIVIQFMCQQINCIRNLEGEVVQVSPPLRWIWPGPFWCVLGADSEFFLFFAIG